eukprot:TRINITY_DN18046_c0_g1_i2.p1 TRINITY_DN18046_c0_g1~~TRINITY_DN18046_c0_g1_i2.p1  ORF type:complete len:321 (-),score=51.49 TRINITY_DN18046_c0_g1_i2:214-1071(-)
MMACCRGLALPPTWDNCSRSHRGVASTITSPVAAASAVTTQTATAQQHRRHRGGGRRSALGVAWVPSNNMGIDTTRSVGFRQGGGSGGGNRNEPAEAINVTLNESTTCAHGDLVDATLHAALAEEEFREPLARLTGRGRRVLVQALGYVRRRLVKKLHAVPGDRLHRREIRTAFGRLRRPRLATAASSGAGVLAVPGRSRKRQRHSAVGVSSPAVVAGFGDGGSLADVGVDRDSIASVLDGSVAGAHRCAAATDIADGGHVSTDDHRRSYVTAPTPLDVAVGNAI